MANRSITPEDAGLAATMYLDGMCLEQIGRELGFSRGGIKKWLVKMDIEIDSKRRDTKHSGCFKAGFTPWNAGKKNAQTAWNKGLTKKDHPSISKMGFQLGDKCVNWKGGVSTANMIIRKSWEHRYWSRRVLERDDFTCQICKIRGGVLHANHIKKFSDYPELRFEDSNGITLCKSCHFGKVNQHEDEWEQTFTNIINKKLVTI